MRWSLRLRRRASRAVSDVHAECGEQALKLLIRELEDSLVVSRANGRPVLPETIAQLSLADEPQKYDFTTSGGL